MSNFKLIPPYLFTEIIDLLAKGDINSSGAKRLIKIYGLFYANGIEKQLNTLTPAEIDAKVEELNNIK